jgi:hypothetical protein
MKEVFIFSIGSCNEGSSVLSVHATYQGALDAVRIRLDRVEKERIEANLRGYNFSPYEQIRADFWTDDLDYFKIEAHQIEE